MPYHSAAVLFQGDDQSSPCCVQSRLFQRARFSSIVPMPLTAPGRPAAVPGCHQTAAKTSKEASSVLRRGPSASPNVDLQDESARVFWESHLGTMRAQSAVGWCGNRGLAALLAGLVAAFCLLSVAPASATDPGCQGHEASSSLCAQSGPSEPLAGVLIDVAPALTTGSPVAGLAPVRPSAPLPQLHAAPSTPRAPPLFRA